MATDPMISSGVAYSINNFTGNGSKTSWDFNFSGGYISTDHVKAYTTDALGAITLQTVAFTGPNTVTITPAVPSGVKLTIYRDTPKDAPVVDFTDGGIVNEADLDQLAKQSTFASAEMVDRFAVFATMAQTALAQSTAAIANASAITGGDFTKFARTDVATTYSAAQAFSGAITVPTKPVGDNTTAAASTAFVVAQIAAGSFLTAAALTGYSTTAQMNTAISTAVSPLATSSSVSAETTRAKNIEGFLMCMALR